MKCGCRGEDGYACLRCVTLNQWHKDIKQTAGNVGKPSGDGETAAAWRDEYKREHIALGLMLDLYAS